MSKPAKKKQTKKSQKSQPKSQKSKKVAKKPAQLIDLDAVEVVEDVKTEPVAPTKPDLGLRLHALNVRLPWLKVVLLVLLAGVVAVSVEEILRHNVSQPVVAPAENVAESIAEAESSQAEPNRSESKSEPTQAESPIAPAQPSQKGVKGATRKPAETKVPIETEKKPTEKPKAESQAAESKPTVTKPVSQSSGRKLVALTFDDGPSAAQTPRLLQILREKNVKATFFVLGNLAKKSPEILRQEEAEGHEVGSHTMTHANLKRSTLEELKWELSAVNSTFVEILGHAPTLMRPPYGNINNNVRNYANLPLILWAVDPEDWRYRDVATVRRNVVYNTFDGAIILLHDIHATTVDAVAGIIDDLKAAGYEFMTVSELAAARGIKLQNGVVYGSFRP